jgi:predicted GIY-YIG superfamily endonuclease
MFYVYVLWSDKLEKRYVGSASGAARRLTEHNNGRNRYTKGGIPWVLIHTEKYEDLPSARRREAFLKTGAGRAWLDKHFPRYRHKERIK